MYSPDDVFQIKINEDSGLLEYLMNGEIVHTSSVAPALPLYVDIAMSSMATTTGLLNIQYIRKSGATITVDDLHDGGGCGPILVAGADTSTESNCDRGYLLGSGFQAFFDAYGGDKFLIQDAHDPNDHNWDDETFARVNIPAGCKMTMLSRFDRACRLLLLLACNLKRTTFMLADVADLFLFVPGGSSNGHSHGPNEMPNVIDPRGGWEDMGVSYQEANGIPRDLYMKSGVEGSYALYHAVAQGWGYLYMVSVRCSSNAATPIDCTQVSQPDVSPTECYDNVEAGTPLWMDRNYAWIDGPSDLIDGGWTYFRVSLEPGAGAPCSDPQNPNANGREGGFDGNIAADATIAICCANHCGQVNTPIDQDVLSSNPSSTIDWVVQ